MRGKYKLFMIGLLSLVWIATMHGGSPTTATCLIGVAQLYIDTSQLKAFKVAFNDNLKSASPMTPEAFFEDYCAKNPDFEQACWSAIEKAKTDQAKRDAQAKNDELSKEIADLQEQLDDNKKLTERDKKNYESQIQSYQNQMNQLQQQVANAQTQAAQAAQQAAQQQQQQTSPQQQDNSQMMQMMMMMMMAMMQNNNGGGGEDDGGGDDI